MLVKIQNQIELLYQQSIKNEIIQNCVNTARDHDISPSIAAILAVKEAYTSGELDVKFLTINGYEALIQSMESEYESVKLSQPDNDELIKAYEQAIAQLRLSYEMKKDPLHLLHSLRT